MVRNYISVAVRNLTKHKFYSLINILGLSIGLTCFLFISLFVIDELSYDDFQHDVDQVYRMDFEGAINGNVFVTALASAPTAATMLADFPEVEDATRMRQTGDWLVKRKQKDITFKEERVVYADKNFFEFFDIRLVKGDPSTALDRPNTLVMNRTTAQKIFGHDEPIGEVVVLDNKTDYEVTGIYEDMPSNMHFHYDMMLSMEGREEAKSKVWLSFNFNTYLKLARGASPDTLEAKFPALIEKYIGPEVEQFMGQSLEDFAASGNKAGFFLVPMKDIHLYADKLGELEQNGDITYVYIFSAIALFILILACINFMNLSTARSANRSKEVGVRKVLGAYKQHLIFQFLSEAFLITLVSIMIAYAATFLLLPDFNSLAEKSIDIRSLFSPLFLGIGAGVLVVVGFLAGSYPAFYLSSFRPVEVLKGKLNLGMKSGRIRGMLVILQFTVSIVMMVGTVIVYHQLNFIQNKKLGYDKEQVIMLHDAWLIGDRLEAFKTEAMRNSHIKRGTISSFLPVNTTNNNRLWFKGKTAGSGDSYVLHNYYIDHDYMETLGMEIAEGRNFSHESPSDSTSILINEAAARHLGLTSPLGEYMVTYGGDDNEPVSEAFKIIGVIKDFHFSTMRTSIEPIILLLGQSRGFISFKLAPDDTQGSIAHLRDLWDEFAPGLPFAYSFLDERFANMYDKEQRDGKIATLFSLLAIFIACLGLYGLAAFTAEQKIKEIGIRKVLGASIGQIILLLSREFLKLVAVSFVLGSFISYFAMREWLNDFVYRIDINNPFHFVFAGMAAFLIAWSTMGFQSYRAARSNPVNSLKNE